MMVMVMEMVINLKKDLSQKLASTDDKVLAPESEPVEDDPVT